MKNSCISCTKRDVCKYYEQCTALKEKLDAFLGNYYGDDPNKVFSIEITCKYSSVIPASGIITVPNPDRYPNYTITPAVTLSSNYENCDYNVSRTDAASNRR